MSSMKQEGSIIKEGGDQIDLDSGYFTRDTFLEDSDASSKYAETTTQLIRDLKQTRDGMDWYLTSITLPAGMLFPDGTVDSYKWIVAPIVSLSEDEKLPIPGSDETYSSRVAIEDAKQFEKFQEGLVYLGML